MGPHLTEGTVARPLPLTTSVLILIEDVTLLYSL